MHYDLYILYFGFLSLTLFWNPVCLCYKNSRAKIAHLIYNKRERPHKYNCTAFLSHFNGHHGHILVRIGAATVTDVHGSKPTNLEPIVDTVQRKVVDNSGIEPDVAISTVRRLEYSRTVILDTFAAAREADKELTGNSLEVDQEEQFCRFDGDDENERMLVAAKSMEAGDTVMSVPMHFCLSLTKIKDELFANYNALRSTPTLNSFESGYVNHVEKLCSLNIGSLMVERNSDVRDHSGGQSVGDIDGCNRNDTTNVSGYDGGTNKDGFESRLSAYIAVKRLQLLKTLIIADSTLATGEVLETALESKDMIVAHLNRHERELMLLSLAMATEYYLGVVSTVLRMIRDPSALQKPLDVDIVKLGWIHHLSTKDMGHLPLLMPSSAVKQIQESVISHRIRQRLLSVNDMFNVAQDPLYLIQDRIEYLAQAHYKLEDTMPTKSGCGPLMDNRKIMAESALESIEAELLAFEKDDALTKLGGLFHLSREDMLSIIGAPESKGSGGPPRPVNILKFFEEYLTGLLEPERYKDVTHDSWLEGINTLVSQSRFTRLFATTTAHNIRVQRQTSQNVASLYLERSFLQNGAQGISARAPIVNGDKVNVQADEAYIVPLIDLSNHKSSDASCVLEFGDDRKFILKTQRPIQVGEEITINYGEMDNNVLMLDYGILPPLEHDKGVLMEVEPGFIRQAAASRNIEGLLPKSFPAGLAMEKRKLLSKLNMFELPSDKNFLQLYNEPHFEGLPVEKYNEFNAKFMGRECAKNPLNNDVVDMHAINQETSEYQPVMIDLFPADEGGCANVAEPMKIIKVEANGVPDDRLIPVLKICFCKTKKRLQWIAEQDVRYLSTSINSPLDLEVFKVASFVCCEYIKYKFQQNIIDDLRQVVTPDLIRVSRNLCGSTLEAMRNCNTIEIPNALVLAHALRSKIPLYRCASYFDKIARDFELNARV